VAPADTVKRAAVRCQGGGGAWLTAAFARALSAARLATPCVALARAGRSVESFIIPSNHPRASVVAIAEIQHPIPT
jgi:hypothetical protein